MKETTSIRHRVARALALVLLASLPFLSGMNGGFVEDDFPISRVFDAWTAPPRRDPGDLTRPPATPGPAHPGNAARFPRAIAIAERCREIARRNGNTALADHFAAIRARLLAMSSGEPG